MKVIPSKIAPRLCTECSHYKAKACYRKAYTKLSLVTGETVIHGIIDANKQRSNIFMCSTKGRYYVLRTD